MLHFKEYDTNGYFAIKVGYNTPTEIIKLLSVNPTKLIDTDHKYHHQPMLDYFIEDIKQFNHDNFRIGESKKYINKYSVIIDKDKILNIYIGDGWRESVKLGIAAYKNKSYLKFIDPKLQLIFTNSTENYLSILDQMGFDQNISSLYLADIPIYILLKRSPLIWAFIISHYRMKLFLNDNTELDKLLSLGLKMTLLTNFTSLIGSSAYYHYGTSYFIESVLSGCSRSVPILKSKNYKYQVDNLEPFTVETFKSYLLTFLYDSSENNNV